jgi:broad specificity phosphatase PhoE
MNLYLIRHGSSLGNEHPDVYFQMHDSKIPLTELGKEQALNAGENLKYMIKDTPVIISSPYTRAKQTAKIIHGFIGGITVESPLIREREWGSLREDINQFDNKEDQKHLFDFYYRPLNGESFADLYQRAFLFLSHLRFNYLNTSNIIIASHGEFIKVLLMLIDNKTVDEFEKLANIKNCVIHVREINYECVKL